MPTPVVAAERWTVTPQRRDATVVLVSAVGAAIGGAVFWLAHRVMIDDAFIAMSYARQIGLHGNWGMVDGLPSNTATSPLSVLVLGGLTAVVRDPPAAVGVLMVVCFAVCGWWMHGIAVAMRLGRIVLPMLALTMLAVNPLLMSSMGLESQLALTLLVGAGWAVVTGRPTVLGVLAGLLTLTRPDLAPAALVCLLLARSGRPRALAAMVATTVPWFAFSWWFLGSAVPDTVVIKGPESWGGVSFWNSVPHYFGIIPAPVALSVLPAVVGAVAMLWWWRERLAWVWAGAALTHYVTMSLLHPGPFFWHSTFWLCGLGLVGCLAVAGLLTRAGAVRVVVASGAAAYLLATALSSANDGLPRDRFAPVSFNWASAAQYETIAAGLPSGSTVLSPGEIGTLAYFCDCRVVDQFADRGRFTPLLEKRLASSGGITRTLLEWNYARFDRPTATPLDYQIKATMVPPGVPAQMTSLFTRWGREVTVVPAP